MTEATPVKAAVKRAFVGRVTSTKMTRTVTVKVERQVQHPLYGKYLTRSNKFHADTGEGTYSEGDLVEITECRPLSRTKTWIVTKLLEKGSNV
jgi:small subunit ribosomal protein S17